MVRVCELNLTGSWKSCKQLHFLDYLVLKHAPPQPLILKIVLVFMMCQRWLCQHMFYSRTFILLLFQEDFFSCLIDFTLCCLETQSNPTHVQGYATTDRTPAQPWTISAYYIPPLSITTLASVGILAFLKRACVLTIPGVLQIRVTGSKKYIARRLPIEYF